MMGKIVSIKRFEIHDGDGIRTTVFLKGCPLSCRWCHNPECIEARPELVYLEQKCLQCGMCEHVCPAHTMKGGKHVYKADKCSSCGKCTEICPGGALKYYGTEISAEELVPKLIDDFPFFKASGGEVTISGGEPLMQPGFTKDVLERLKREDVHTAVDTCGFCTSSVIRSMIPFVDTFLYDIKAFDADAHIRATGQSNEQILNNLKILDKAHALVEIRIPFVPKYNADQIEKIACFLETLSCVKQVKLLPYHSFGNSKYQPLGRKAEHIPLPTEEEIQYALYTLRSHVENVEDG